MSFTIATGIIGPMAANANNPQSAPATDHTRFQGRRCVPSPIARTIAPTIVSSTSEKESMTISRFGPPFNGFPILLPVNLPTASEPREPDVSLDALVLSLRVQFR